MRRFRRSGDWQSERRDFRLLDSVGRAASRSRGDCHRSHVAGTKPGGLNGPPSSIKKRRSRAGPQLDSCLSRRLKGRRSTRTTCQDHPRRWACMALADLAAQNRWTKRTKFSCKRAPKLTTVSVRLAHLGSPVKAAIRRTRPNYATCGRLARDVHERVQLLGCASAGGRSGCLTNLAARNCWQRIEHCLAI